MNSKYAFLLLMVLAFTAFSCHKDHDSGSAPSKVQIIGTWDAQSVYTRGYHNGELISSDTTSYDGDAGNYSKVEFKNDQTYTATSVSEGETDVETGTYSISGNTITIIETDMESGEKETVVMDCSINGNIMILKQHFQVSTNGETGEVKIEIHFKKE